MVQNLRRKITKNKIVSWINLTKNKELKTMVFSCLQKVYLKLMFRQVKKTIKT
jgi:hypothetical protein